MNKEINKWLDKSMQHVFIKKTCKLRKPCGPCKPCKPRKPYEWLKGVGASPKRAKRT